LLAAFAVLLGWLAVSYEPAPRPIARVSLALEPAPPPPAAAPARATPAPPEPAPPEPPLAEPVVTPPPAAPSDRAPGEPMPLLSPRPVPAPEPSPPAPPEAASMPPPAEVPESSPAEVLPAAPPSPPPAPAPEPRVAALPLPTPPPTAPPAPEERIALPAVPDPDLVVQTAKGPLPVIAPDGRQAWQVYARPFVDRSARARISIVVAGMGLSRSATNAAIQQLPGTVTLAFAPFASDLEAWIEQARAAGHEVMLQLPMEPFDYPVNDPGPYTLLTSLSVEDNIERLEWLLSRFTGYVGVTNYMGSRFTSSPQHMRPILTVLKERGLMFLDSRSSRNSVAAGIADEIELARALNNRFLDNVASRTAIDARLDDIERIAQTTGFAIGIGFPYPVTIERVAAWAATLERKDLVLTPVSALVNQQPS